MEQIKSGIMELMKNVAVGHLAANKTDSANSGESEFGKLLEKKQSETDTVPEEKTAAEEKVQGEQKTEETAKAESDREEDTCDVAREAACAQMVWLTPEAVQTQQPVVQEVSVETAVAELANANTAAGESAMPAQNGELMPQQTEKTETAQTAETGLPVQQTVQTAEDPAAAGNDRSGARQFAEQPETDVQVKVETDEPSGDAAVEQTPLFKDVEAAPIKVAEAPQAPEASDVSRQISEKLNGALENGETKVEIQLTPETLGKVTVELTRSADGTLSILLNAENQQTRELLSRHASILQEAIMDRGQQNVQVEVSRGEEAQQQNEQQDLQDGRNGHNSDQQRRQKETSSEDFMQQLRLGLIDMQEET